MRINRQLQLNILQALRDIYPDALLVQNLPGYAMDRNFMGNLFYLREHGLIAGGDIREPGQCRSMIDVEITKDGLDLLESDGGLEAILGHSNLVFDRVELIEKLGERLKGIFSDSAKAESVKTQLKNLPPEKLHSFLLHVFLESLTSSPEIIETLSTDP